MIDTQIKYFIVNSEGDIWFFTNTSKLAEFLDTEENFVNYCVREGKKCKGWQIQANSDIKNRFLFFHWSSAHMRHQVDPNNDVEYFYHLWDTADPEHKLVAGYQLAGHADPLPDIDKIDSEYKRWQDIVKKSNK